MDDIQIAQDKTYTFSEVIDAVKQTLEQLSEKSENNELRYSATDLYWLLYDMVRYVNQNIPGEFVLQQVKRGTYRVRYASQESSRQRSSQKLKAEVDRTAKYLEELTGRPPTWCKKE